MEDTQIIPIKDAVNRYLTKDVVEDFSKFPVYEKLSLFAQKTPKKYIKQRKVGGKMVKYTPYQYPRKVLNFVFNFKVSNEVMNEEYFEYDEEYFDEGKKKTRHVIEAEVTVKYTFQADGDLIIRTVISSHKQFQNKALTRADAKKGALSKSWTLVAQSFGICADLDKDPEDIIIDIPQEAPTQSGKSFDPASEDQLGY